MNMTLLVNRSAPVRTIMMRPSCSLALIHVPRTGYAMDSPTGNPIALIVRIRPGAFS